MADIENDDEFSGSADAAVPAQDEDGGVYFDYIKRNHSLAICPNGYSILLCPGVAYRRVPKLKNPGDIGPDANLPVPRRCRLRPILSKTRHSPSGPRAAFFETIETSIARINRYASLRGATFCIPVR